MAKVTLNRVTFTSLAIAAKSLVQFNGGPVQLADTATPAEDDWVACSENMLLVLETNKFARATGTRSSYASSVLL